MIPARTVKQCIQSQVSKTFFKSLSFYRSQNILCRSKFLEPAKKFDCICAGTKTNFTECKIFFLSGKKCLWLPHYVNTFLVWHKKFGPAQNILGPVIGQGICLHKNCTLWFDRKKWWKLLRFLALLEENWHVHMFNEKFSVILCSFRFYHLTFFTL